jgi:hypothetical protein
MKDDESGLKVTADKNGEVMVRKMEKVEGNSDE